MPQEYEVCPARWPADAGVLLHTAERIHFVLFVATLAYFGLLAIAITIFLRRMQGYAAIEAVEAARSVGSAAQGASPGSEHGASTAGIKVQAENGDEVGPAQSTESGVWDALLQSFPQRRQLHAVRKFLLDSTFADAPDAEAKRPALSMRAFIQRNSKSLIETLIELPVRTCA